MSKIDVCIVVQIIEDQYEKRLVIVESGLDDDHLVMAAGFDPYNPFADLKIQRKSLSNANLIKRFLKQAVNHSEAEAIYHTNFNQSYKIKFA